MALFAQLNVNNIVSTVHSVNDNELLVDGVLNEQKGVDFLNNLFKTNHVWKQTYADRSKRKHRAGVGYVYDEVKDAFIAPQPYASWTLNEDTCIWEAPVPHPNDGKPYAWDEGTLSWKEFHPSS